MKPKNTTEETFKIPFDVLLDVLGIIVKARLKHEVVQVQESRSIVVVTFFLDKGLEKHQQAMQSITDILEEYHEYRWSDHEEINWREN